MSEHETHSEHAEHEHKTHTHAEAPKNNSMKYILGAIVVVLLAVAGYKFLLKPHERAERDERTEGQAMMKADQDKTAAPQTATVFDATAAQADAEGVVTIPVEAGSFYYKPNEIHAKQGQKIKIQLKSVDMMHNFVIDELGVNMPVTKGGSSAEATFTADKVGTFEYYCGVGQHRQKGQVGKLIIAE